MLMGLRGPEDPWEWGVSVGLGSLGVLMGVLGGAAHSTAGVCLWGWGAVGVHLYLGLGVF